MATKKKIYATSSDSSLDASDASSDYELKDDSSESNDSSNDSDESNDSSESDESNNDKKDSKITKPMVLSNKSNDDLPDYDDLPYYDDLPDNIFTNSINDIDFEVPYEIFSEKPKKVISNEEKNQELRVVPFVLRKSFPFCFWYISHADDKEIIKLKKIILNVIQKILNVKDDCEIYLIRGNKEKDRIRIICPDIFVDSQISKDLRSLILRDLGYKIISNIIPVLIYEVPITPTILLPRIWDMGLDKWESYQTYSCILHQTLKTEEIEKLMLKWSVYESSQKLTVFTDKYIDYLKIKDSSSNVLEEEELVAILIGDSVISDDIKKEFGNNLDNCIEWFKKYHPDSGLRLIKKIGEDSEVFILDFTKSKHKCRLCDLIHLSNRQYLTYSNKSKKAFYHCYDSNAKDKKHVISFQQKKRGADVVSVM